MTSMNLTVTDPNATTLSELHYLALVNVLKQVGELTPEQANWLLPRLVDRLGRATYAQARSLDSRTIEQAVDRSTGDFFIGPIGIDEICTVFGAIDIATPVVRRDQVVCLPYRIQDGVLTMARVGDMWRGKRVEEVPPTAWQLDPYNKRFVGPNTEVASIDGEEFPIGTAITDWYGQPHQWWQDAITRTNTTLDEVVMALLHHPECRQYTSGQPFQIERCLTEPAGIGLNADRCWMVANRAVGLHQLCFNAYVTAATSTRKEVAVTKSGGIQQAAASSNGSSDYTPQNIQALSLMLQSMFGASQLRRFAYYHMGGKETGDALPTSCSLSGLAEALMEVALERKLITSEFFKELRKAREFRIAEIDAVAARFGY